MEFTYIIHILYTFSNAREADNSHREDIRFNSSSGMPVINRL